MLYAINLEDEINFLETTHMRVCERFCHVNLINTDNFQFLVLFLIFVIYIHTCKCVGRSKENYGHSMG